MFGAPKSYQLIKMKVNSRLKPYMSSYFALLPSLFLKVNSNTPESVQIACTENQTIFCLENSTSVKKHQIFQRIGNAWEKLL